MTNETPPPAPSDVPPSATSGSRADQVSALAAYLAANQGRFTDAALEQAALDAGYPKDVLAEARAARAADPAVAIRQRARRWVLAAYGITFVLLLLGMFANPAARAYGGSVIGAIVLALTLGLALAIALFVVRRSRPNIAETGAMVMTGILAIPVILLVVVAGLCVATGLPIPRPS
jgi:hypothetical protein